MSKYVGMGRLFFRPKNTKLALEGVSPILIAGMIAFQTPSPLMDYEGGYPSLDTLPQEQLVDVRVTVEILARYVPESEYAKQFQRGTIQSILLDPQYAHPEEYEFIRIVEK